MTSVPADVGRALQEHTALEVAGDPDPGRLHLLRGSVRLYALRWTEEPARLRWSVETVSPPRPTDDDAAEALQAMLAVAEQAGASTIEVVADEVLLRRHARAAGLHGELRGVLRGDLPSTPEPEWADVPDAEVVARLLQQLVSGARVEPGRPPGMFRALVRAATSGLRDTVRVRVAAPEGSPLLFVLPGRVPLLFEAVAQAIETALAVRRRFARELGHLRAVSFDRSEHGFLAGEWAGVAQPNVALVHVNADYVTPAGVAGLRAARPEATASGVAEPEQGTAIDAIVAHELWHHVDAVFQVRRYSDSVEFRRRLGEHLGVETLEHACAGGPGGPDARLRLVEEVSVYATTNVVEATAEMFVRWWLDHPSPVVERFGELVESFLPGQP